MLTTDDSLHSGWFDSHCHLNDVPNASHCLMHARQKDIQSLLIPGIHPTQWPELTAFSDPNIHFALGTHPWYVQDPDEEADILSKLLVNSEAVAVGEIGLDFHEGKTARPAKDVQIKSFEQQLEVAQYFRLPVIIHCVKAHTDVLKRLKRMNNAFSDTHPF